MQTDFKLCKLCTSNDPGDQVVVIIIVVVVLIGAAMLLLRKYMAR